MGVRPGAVGGLSTGPRVQGPESCRGRAMRPRLMGSETWLSA